MYICIYVYMYIYVHMQHLPAVALLASWLYHDPSLMAPVITGLGCMNFNLRRTAFKFQFKNNY